MLLSVLFSLAHHVGGLLLSSACAFFAVRLAKYFKQCKVCFRVILVLLVIQRNTDGCFFPAVVFAFLVKAIFCILFIVYLFCTPCNTLILS